MNNTEKTANKIKIWSLGFRLYHWLLAASVITCIYTAEFSDGFESMEIHTKVGTFILCLLFFRFFWGIWGDDTTRFVKFIPTPQKAWKYLTKDIWQRSSSQSIGHSPSAALGAISILLVLLFQAVTGLFATDDIITEGPLCKLLDAEMCNEFTSIHHTSGIVLKLLIGAHLSALLFYTFYKKENLVPAMFNGYKKLVQAKNPPKMQSVLWVIITFILAVAIVYGFLEYI